MLDPKNVPLQISQYLESIAEDTWLDGHRYMDYQIKMDFTDDRQIKADIRTRNHSDDNIDPVWGLKIETIRCDLLIPWMDVARAKNWFSRSTAINKEE